MRSPHCTSGCATQDHATYADCLKDKGTRPWMVAISKGFEVDKQRRWDGELQAYRDARAEGIQPDGTTMGKIDKAKRLSDLVGAAYGRDFNAATPLEG